MSQLESGKGIDQSDSMRLWPYFIGIGVFVFILWFSALWIVKILPKASPADSISFSVGIYEVINTLFSGLAFAGVICTIILQSSELRMQRRELESTREEIKGQKQQLEMQNKTLKLQSFENTFVQLIKLHNELIGRIGGSSSFNSFHKRIRDNFEKIKTNLNDRLMLSESYIQAYKEYCRDFGNYFSNFYYIVKYINDSDIDNKKFYMNLLSAKLTHTEKAILFYHCLSDIGKDIKPIVDKYDFMNDVPDDLLVHPDHKSLYKNSIS